MMKFQAQADQLYVLWQVFVPQQREKTHAQKYLQLADFF